MRIIAGHYRGQTLRRPPEETTRPTSGRTREAIFNILQHHPEVNLRGAVVWDVFAGSGALGLEALSRGASQVVFVEKDPRVIEVLRENIRHLKVEKFVRIIKGDGQGLKGPEGPADLLFMDPPYHQNLELPTLLTLREMGVLAPQTLVVLETSKTTDLSYLENQFVFQMQRSYGAAKVTLMTQLSC